MSLLQSVDMDDKEEGEPMEEDTGMECSDDSKDTSDDDEDDKAREEELNVKIRQLKKELSKNPSYYDGYTNLIDAYKELGDLDELRKIRQKMSEVYPLTPTLWLSWLKDEQNIATSKEERAHIVTLFKRAVKDYMSVPLWVEYIMFMLGGGDKDATRGVCEAALTAVGTHVGEGQLVWTAVLLTEAQVYASIEAIALSDPSEEKSKEQEKQLKKIQSLYKRQVRVPLLNVDIESLIADMSPYFKDSLESQIEVDLQKTMAKLKGKITYEENLLRSSEGDEKFCAYNRYLAYVKETDSPSSVINLYERAITDNALSNRLWEDYINFLVKQFPTADYLILPACKRSLRNCPWSGRLVEMYINALQKFENDEKNKQNIDKKINGVVELCFSSCTPTGPDAVKIWMSYLVYLRRNIDWQAPQDQEKIEKFRTHCFKAIDMIDRTYGEEGDIESEIPRFLAHIEAEFIKNMENARSIWNDNILQKNNNNKNTNLWMEFINLERCYGTEKHCRKHFRKALERVWDWVEVIGTAYQRYEQECGTQETYEDFQKKYNDRLAVVMKVREEAAAKEEAKNKPKNSKKDKRKQQQPQKRNNQIKSEEFKAPYPIDSKEAYDQKEKDKVSSKTSCSSPSRITPPPGYLKKEMEDSCISMPPPGLKKEMEDLQLSVSMPPPGYPGKSPPASAPSPPGVSGKDVPPPPGYPGKAATPPPPPGYPGQAATPPPPPGYPDKSAEPPPGFIYHSPQSPSRRSPSPSPCPSPSPQSPSRSSKRPAEDEKDDNAGADQKKIKVDDEKGSRTIDDEKGSRTVFLKNLSFKATDKDIRSIFYDCGEIESLEFVKDFQGRNKGFAYLIFKKIHSAQAALTKDRQPIQGRPLYVNAYEPKDGPKEREHYFKFKTGVEEKDKLFIKGLPFSMTEVDVKKLFLPHGPIKDIRLVVYRNGYSKGTCYIDYYDEKTAAKVKSAMDGAEVEDKIIAVYFSNPPTKGGAPNPVRASLGGADGVRQPGSQKGRLNLLPRSLLPRALQRNAGATSSKSGADPASGSNGSGNLEKPKSNEDFRKMLLKN